LSVLSTTKRLRIALGGFLSFTGFIILIMVIFTETGAADMQAVLQNGVMVGAVAILGLLDVLCGLMLFYREKRLKDLIASQKRKPRDDVE
jgi:hypothetical protein